MLNQFVGVGRLVAEPSVKETEDGKQVSNITIAVPRSYKNENGEYDTDFVDVVLWNGIAENTAEYCHKGDIIGVKGRIQTSNYETEDGEKRKPTQIDDEKIKFLSSSKDKKDVLETTKDDDMDM